jgi:hypothetical protein
VATPRTAAELIERAVDEARKLPDYESSDEESTARHAVPQDIHFHVHPSQPDAGRESSPEIEIGPVTVRGLPRWATIAIVVTGLVAAAATAIASHFAAK